MSRVVKREGKSKGKTAREVEIKRLREYERMELDSKAALIQELIPLGLMHIDELLQAEVLQLSGERYRRNGQPEYSQTIQVFDDESSEDGEFTLDFPKNRGFWLYKR